MRHFLRVLNIACFRRKRFDRGCRLYAVAAFGFGSSGAHPHSHLAIAAKADMDFSAFERLIKKAVRKTKLFDQQCMVEKYRDEFWIKYMRGHQESLYFDLPRPANSIEHRANCFC